LSKLKGLGGKTIKTNKFVLVLTLAMLSVPVMAQGFGGDGGVDILGKDGGIFETEGSAFRFPESADVNFDSLTVGNDRALAIGPGKDPIATNNLEIKKNQDSGACECCNSGKVSCRDCCIKVNLEQVKVGNRDAMAFGLSEATNNVKIVTNQQ
jgi:hypothetical protein